MGDSLFWQSAILSLHCTFFLQVLSLSHTRQATSGYDLTEINKKAVLSQRNRAIPP